MSTRFERSSEGGVAMLEFLIGSCILFFLMFSIFDMSLIVSRRVLVADALRSAVTQGSRQLADCEASAVSHFQNIINNQTLVGANSIKTVTPLITDREQLGAPGVVSYDHELTLTVEAEFPCGLFCTFVLDGVWMKRSSLSGAHYTTSYSLPIEPDSTCS